MIWLGDQGPLDIIFIYIENGFNDKARQSLHLSKNAQSIKKINNVWTYRFNTDKQVELFAREWKYLEWLSAIWFSDTKPISSVTLSYDDNEKLYVKYFAYVWKKITSE